MESLTPLGTPKSPAKRVEFDKSKEGAAEIKLFLKTIDSQGSSSVVIGTWEGKKFTLANDAKQMDLQLIALSIFSGQEGIEYTQKEQTLLIKALLEAGISSNASDQEKKTLLHHAVRFGNLELIRELINRKEVNIDAKDDVGRTALSYAAEQGNIEISKLLIAKGADVNTVSDDLPIPSFSSAPNHAPDSDIPKYYKSYYWKMTPLHYAAIGGHAEVVNLLLDKGALADAQNSDGMTPLHLSASLGNVDVTKSLITPHSINLLDEEGYSPLLLAIIYQHPQAVEILLSSNADPNVSDKLNGSSPLHYAASYPEIQIVEMLINKGAKIDALNNEGKTVFHFAVMNNNLDCIELLAKKNANINSLSGVYKYTPLHEAETAGLDQAVRILMKLGANPNFITTCGVPLNCSKRANPGDLYPEETKILSAECHRRKILALRFGISGHSKVSPDPNSEELELEGFSTHGAELVKESMNKFLIDQNEKEKEIFEGIWNEVNAAFQEIPIEAYELQEQAVNTFLKRFNQGKPAIIPTGWQGHAVYMVFIKTKDDVLIIECNRGERSRVEEGGFGIYRVKNTKQINQDTLRRLVSANDRTFVEDFIHHRLGISAVEHVGLKDQKEGSCAFTSTKTAILATLYVLLKDKYKDNSAALAKAKLIYRNWTQYDRAIAINDIIDEYENNPSPPYQRDYHLLLSVLSMMKMSPPVHAEYLKAHQRLMDFLDKHAPEPWSSQQVDITYRSPLAYAIHTNQKDLIKLMLKKGCDINAKDSGNWTPLQRAISEGNKDMMSFLIKHGAKLTADPGDDPPIHTAINCNRPDLALYLLSKMKKQKMDLNPVDSMGCTLVHNATKINATRLIDILNRQRI